MLIALALVLAIAVAVPAAATIPAADLSLVDLEGMSTSSATSPLLPPAELPIALPPPANGPPVASLEAPPNVHLRVALAVAVARVSACPQAENRIRGSRAVGSVQLFGNTSLRCEIAPGDREFRNRYFDPKTGRFLTPDPLGYVDGPSMYQGFANSPLNYGDPLGLYCLGFLGSEDTQCTDWVPYWEPGVYHQSRAELLKQHRDSSLTQADRNRAAMKANIQIPGFFVEEGLRFLWNSIAHGTAADHDAIAAVEKRFRELAGHDSGAAYVGALAQLETEGYDTSLLVKGGMPGPPSGRIVRVSPEIAQARGRAAAVERWKELLECSPSCPGQRTFASDAPQGYWPSMLDIKDEIRAVLREDPRLLHKLRDDELGHAVINRNWEYVEAFARRYPALAGLARRGPHVLKTHDRGWLSLDPYPAVRGRGGAGHAWRFLMKRDNRGELIWMPWLAVRLDPEWSVLCDSSSGRLGVLFHESIELLLGCFGPRLPFG